LLIDSKKKAFSLAEVLIALVIIGIVVAITIPALAHDTQDKQFRAKWIKLMSTLIQGTVRLQTANGGQLWDMTTSSNMMEEYKNYLILIKEVNSADSLFLDSTLYRCYKGSPATCTAYPNAPAGILSDGSYVVFKSENNCSASESGLSGICGSFIVDVNGVSPPNMWGKDLFQAWVVYSQTKGYQVFPVGSNGDGYTCQAESEEDSTSLGCSTYSLLHVEMPNT